MPEGMQEVHDALNAWLDEGDLAPTPEQRLKLHQFVDQGYSAGYGVGIQGLSDAAVEQRVLNDSALTARIIEALDSKIEEEVDRSK